MAWPGNRRRSVALGYDRRVGIYEPQEFRYVDEQTEPEQLADKGGIYLKEPPRRPPSGQDNPLTNCGPPQRYNMQAIVPGCPDPPGRLMYIADSHTIPAGGTAEYVFDSPGIFCPQRLLITGNDEDPDDVPLIFIVSIKTGIRNQIITGLVPAGVYSTDNTCCPPACLDCMCAPGVQLVVTLLNTDVAPRGVTVTLVGAYYDIPAGMTAREASANVRKDFPGCPIPGIDKLVGFTTGSITGRTSIQVDVETPGRFCPRQLFFFNNTNLATDLIFITSIRSPVDDNIISGRIPLRLWSILNKCCVLTCLPCLCMPGVPMSLTIEVPLGETTGSVDGVVLGDYEDVC